MTNVERCPVCHGAGALFDDKILSSVGLRSWPRTCPGCNGRRWVTAADDPPLRSHKYPLCKLSEKTLQALKE